MPKTHRKTAVQASPYSGIGFILETAFSLQQFLLLRKDCFYRGAGWAVTIFCPFRLDLSGMFRHARRLIAKHFRSRLRFRKSDQTVYRYNIFFQLREILL